MEMKIKFHNIKSIDLIDDFTLTMNVVNDAPESCCSSAFTSMEAEFQQWCIMLINVLLNFYSRILNHHGIV